MDYFFIILCYTLLTLNLGGKTMKKITPKDSNKKGKLILVSAMTSNKSGIGKTTISIGLADAMNQLGNKTMLTLREPSMGPVFGIKGGATGGGKAVIEPQEEINLHFMGDFHAIAQANNLLSSIIDNHIFQGNELDIDTNQILHKRCLDINDRSLREIEYNINGNKIKTGFNITAASEVMAIMCISNNIEELKINLGNMLVAKNFRNEPVFAKDLKAEEAMTILLKDALNPNLVKTAGGTSTLVHMGPFANIAHGCNSIIATNTALSMADYCVTEAGFGSDLGAEKFLDIKCRLLNKSPDAVVLVVTINVIKEHGEGDLIKGFENVKRHIHNIKDVFGLNIVVAINKHIEDKVEVINTLITLCKNEGIKVEIAEAFSKGGDGCIELAKTVIAIANNNYNFTPVYELSDSLIDKITNIATKVYGAKDVEYSSIAKEKLDWAEKQGFGNFFVNIAKTQFSFSGDKSLIGAPDNFTLKVTDIEIRCGAKMIVAIIGNMLLMPGLGKNSNYLNMYINPDGSVEGLL